MGRKLLLGLVVVGLISACSGGQGSAGGDTAERQEQLISDLNAGTVASIMRATCLSVGTSSDLWFSAKEEYLNMVSGAESDLQAQYGDLRGAIGDQRSALQEYESTVLPGDEFRSSPLVQDFSSELWTLDNQLDANRERNASDGSRVLPEWYPGSIREGWLKNFRELCVEVDSIGEIGASIVPEASSSGGQRLFELTETVVVESLASSDFQTSLTRIMSLSNGEFMIVDRPRYRSGSGPDEGMYFRYFDSRTLVPLRNVKYDMVGFWTLSPDGRTFSVSTDDGCRLVDVQSGQSVANFAKRRDDLFCFSNFSADGNRFFFTDGGRDASVESAVVRVVEIDTFREVKSMPVAQDARWFFSFEGSIFVLQPGREFGVSNGILVLNEKTGELVSEIPFEFATYYMASSPGSPLVYFATAGTDQVWVLDMRVLEVSEIAQLSRAPMYISVSPDGEMVAIAHNQGWQGDNPIRGIVSIYSVSRDEIFQVIEIPGRYNGGYLEFVTNGRLIVNGGANGNWVDSFHVFDLAASG